MRPTPETPGIPVVLPMERRPASRVSRGSGAFLNITYVKKHNQNNKD